MARDGKGHRGLDEDERVLWTAVTRSVVPLKKAASVRANDAAAPSVLPPRAAAHHRAKTPKMPAPPASPVVRPSPAPPPPALLGRRQRARVARGKVAIDGRLDLHGLTQGEAHATLLRFLRAASERQARLVLVITGKGGSAAPGDGGRGVLRRELPRWLALPEFRALVVGFEPAHVAHGGEGAWYISVRRSRSE